jgi:formamidopyrimidine-DNA glycosylase
MPELPEVESFRLFFEKNALNHRIKSVHVLDIGILEMIDKERFEQTITNCVFTSTFRHGKFLFCQIKPSQFVVFHFGMTGDFFIRDKLDELHKHDRVAFYLDNENIFVFSDQRKFGLVGITANIEEFLHKRNFGPDALLISTDEFLSRILHHKKPIKACLLDQSILAGVGNLYADEALFRTQIHPGTFPNELSKAKLSELIAIVQKILHQAIYHGAYYGDFPADFFIQGREKNGLCPRCNSTLESGKIVGRTSYYCPKCQPGSFKQVKTNIPKKTKKKRTRGDLNSRDPT